MSSIRRAQGHLLLDFDDMLTIAEQALTGR